MYHSKKSPSRQGLAPRPNGPAESIPFSHIVHSCGCSTLCAHVMYSQRKPFIKGSPRGRCHFAGVSLPRLQKSVKLAARCSWKALGCPRGSRPIPAQRQLALASRAPSAASSSVSVAALIACLVLRNARAGPGHQRGNHLFHLGVEFIGRIHRRHQAPLVGRGGRESARPTAPSAWRGCGRWPRRSAPRRRRRASARSW